MTSWKVGEYPHLDLIALLLSYQGLISICHVSLLSLPMSRAECTG